jgi:DNA-binding transcriptional MerR regulator
VRFFGKPKVKKKTEKSSKEKHETPGRLHAGLKSKDVIQLIEALEGVKLDFDHLYYYEHTGLIVPSLRSAKGRGVPKLYSTEDFIVLRWLVSLQKNGIPVSRFREVLTFLKGKMPEVLKEPQNWVLITDGKSVQFFDRVSSRAFDVLKDTGQYLFFFPIGRVADESRKAVKKLGKKQRKDGARA